MSKSFAALFTRDNGDMALVVAEQPGPWVEGAPVTLGLGEDGGPELRYPSHRTPLESDAVPNAALIRLAQEGYLYVIEVRIGPAVGEIAPVREYWANVVVDNLLTTTRAAAVGEAS